MNSFALRITESIPLQRQSDKTFFEILKMQKLEKAPVTLYIKTKYVINSFVVICFSYLRSFWLIIIFC